MSFPPPVRVTAPLLALVFGLVATWFDYRLNLDLDLARHLAEVRERADANGRLLARLSERLLGAGQRESLLADVQIMAELPGLDLAAVVDETGTIVVDSTGTLAGQAAAPALGDAASLIGRDQHAVIREAEDSKSVSSAHPFHIGSQGTGWALLEFDRTAAIRAAQADALAQLGWMASAMTLISFSLWAALHFGFAARLIRLARMMRDFGEGRLSAPTALPGDDEVGELSEEFVAMAATLRARDEETLRLEREVLEVSERERRRIGHDLHDGLGQRLTAASLATNALVAATRDKAPALTSQAEEIGQQLRDAIAEARGLSHGLAPVALADDGLMAGLATLAETTNRAGGVRCVFDCPEPVRVRDAETAGHLYRIAQEAVGNVLKHAGASEIRIGLERRSGTVVLEVDDDGEGIQETTAQGGAGIGLRVMRYRAQLIGATLEISSAPAGGTRISCSTKVPA
jgi:signal transduction histidine kinase